MVEINDKFDDTLLKILDEEVAKEKKFPSLDSPEFKRKSKAVEKNNRRCRRT